MDICFVLSQTQRAENAGAAARAIKTMGFSDLRLVNPGPFDPDKARAVAHGSSDILERAGRYASLGDALNDCDLVIGTTARRRGNRVEYHPSRELRTYLAERRELIHRCALLFGNEESGLSNEDLRLVQVVSTVDLRAAHPSLNLAQAIMIFAYELSPLVLEIRRKEPREPDGKSLRALHGKVEELLGALDLQGEALGHRILERVALAGTDDVPLMHSLVNRIKRRLATGDHASGATKS